MLPRSTEPAHSRPERRKTPASPVDHGTPPGARHRSVGQCRKDTQLISSPVATCSGGRLTSPMFNKESERCKHCNRETVLTNDGSELFSNIL